jgi:hypothetical protein
MAWGSRKVAMKKSLFLGLYRGKCGLTSLTIVLECDAVDRLSPLLVQLGAENPNVILTWSRGRKIWDGARESPVRCEAGSIAMNQVVRQGLID